MDTDARRRLVSHESKFSLNAQLEVLGISKGTFYYEPKGENEENIKVMSEMSIDITYIPMRKGFMYLTAIIDVYSRCIMAWGLHNTLEKVNSIEVLHAAVNAYGNPEIINSDQGSQYTSEEWTSTCEDLGITISMDGHGRCKDNIRIERFWRTIKTE